MKMARRNAPTAHTEGRKRSVGDGATGVMVKNPGDEKRHFPPYSVMKNRAADGKGRR